MVDHVHGLQLRLGFFERQVMSEVTYWGELEAVKRIDVSTLDRERENIPQGDWLWAGGSPASPQPSGQRRAI